MDMEGRKGVRLTVEDRIAVLVIDHPPVNTLDEQTFRALEETFDQAVADQEVKVIVVTGTDRSFVAGADIRMLAGMATVEDAERLAGAGQAFMLKIERSPKPVIAAINGRYCLGGGNELAMACHIRIAEERVKFGQPEICLGLMPGWGGSQRLARLVTGDPVRAKEAHRLGLVNRVVPEGAALDEAKRLAEKIAALSGPALKRAMGAIYAALDMEVEEAMAYEAARFGEMAATEDMREGLSAFLEKRPPCFQDR
jgi:enoyl-CoA hydratase